MLKLTLERVRSAASYYSPVEKHCVGCSGCGQAKAAIFLPSTADEVHLELPVRIQHRLLWNSWLKPLLAFVSAALASACLQLPEPYALVISLAALALGLVSCKAVPQGHLQLMEVNK